jgi:transglutaminase-like putative cysteine protease
MTRTRGSLATSSALAVAAAMTTWVAMLSWTGFTAAPGRFLGPLILLGAVVAGSGVLLRWWRLPGLVVVAVQVVVSLMAASLVLTDSPVPVGAAWHRLDLAITQALDSSHQYAAPVPNGVPGVHPLLIIGGLACLLLVDLFACTLRRVPLAGLPLLTIYSVPVSLTGGGVAWWVFTLTAVGFLAMLFLQEDEQVARWGRQLGHEPGLTQPERTGVRAGAVRRTASRIGGLATGLAVVLPLLVPTASLHFVDFGNGPGGDSEITVRNPMADLRRDLVRGPDVPLVQVTTNDPDPSYLRIALLNRFSDNEWSSGDRDVPKDQLANGSLPPLQGVSASVQRQEFPYQVRVLSDFDSTWLPTQSPISRVNADGDWRYDTQTMDFIAADDSLDTSGLDYSMTSVHLDLSPAQLADSATLSSSVSQDFTELPDSLPDSVRELSFDVTRTAPSRFEKAVALQNWFRRDGGFTYDTAVSLGNGTDDLVAFLTQGDGGRTGYCEQFAAAMAVMARVVGIPARVAVGFLDPTNIGGDTWEYSTRDMHAWPELYFSGSGWVRFEPTPAGRAETVPAYTRGSVTGGPGNGATSQPQATQAPSRRPTAEATPQAGRSAASDANGNDGFPWGRTAGGVGGLLVIAGALLLPRWMRRSRRERLLAGGPEEIWAELHASAVDLGVAWPERRTPRETRDRLVASFSAPDLPAGRVSHGPKAAPEAAAALERLVRALELLRYAPADRRPAPAEGLRRDGEACIAALEAGATRSARRRAEWWPRSVVSRSRRPMPRPNATVSTSAYGGVVDHVG